MTGFFVGVFVTLACIYGVPRLLSMLHKGKDTFADDYRNPPKRGGRR